MAQRQFWELLSTWGNPTKYCYVKTVRGINSLRQPPSIVVTLDPVASVITKYPNLQHTIESPKIFTNLVDALQQCQNQCTLLVDMPCDLTTMIETCIKAKAHGVLGGVYGRVSAGIPLTNSLVIDKDIKVIGTTRGNIASDSVVFIVPRTIQLSLVDLSIRNTEKNDDSPTVSSCGKLSMLNCNISLDARWGSAILVSGRASINNCQIKNNKRVVRSFRC